MPIQLLQLPRQTVGLSPEQALLRGRAWHLEHIVFRFGASHLQLPPACDLLVTPHPSPMTLESWKHGLLPRGDPIHSCLVFSVPIPLKSLIFFPSWESVQQAEAGGLLQV